MRLNVGGQTLVHGVLQPPSLRAPCATTCTRVKVSPTLCQLVLPPLTTVVESAVSVCERCRSRLRSAEKKVAKEAVPPPIDDTPERRRRTLFSLVQGYKVRIRRPQRLMIGAHSVAATSLR